MPASFSSMCFITRTDGGISFLFATGGDVVLAKSERDDVQGTFVLRGTSGDLPPRSLVVTGGFNLGCTVSIDNVRICGPLSTSPSGGTCADLLACCTPDNPTCMQIYNMASPNGDVACGRVLTAFRPTLCL
jgi:hypothetical protein